TEHSCARNARDARCGAPPNEIRRSASESGKRAERIPNLAIDYQKCMDRNRTFAIKKIVRHGVKFYMPDRDVNLSALNQNPPFPPPEELQAKLSEFMKSNFGDRVSFATFAQPERAETGEDEKPAKRSGDHFVFNFLPRDIKAHLDRFVIKQDEAKKV